MKVIQVTILSIVISFFLLSPIPGYSQQEDDIQSIRKEFSRINALTLRKTMKEYSCEQYSGEVTYFMEGGQVVKISMTKSWLGDEYEVEEFYFKNGQCFFAFRALETGPVSETKRTEYRTYLKNDKVIRYLVGQKQARCEECSYTQTSRAYRLLSSLHNDIQAVACE